MAANGFALGHGEQPVLNIAPEDFGGLGDGRLPRPDADINRLRPRPPWGLNVAQNAGSGGRSASIFSFDWPETVDSTPFKAMFEFEPVVFIQNTQD